MNELLLLDGPMGTELLERGVDTPLPGWSAHALDTAPDVVQAIHADYARAGADVHTTNTFRTQPRRFPNDWRRLTRRAVECARAASSGRVAGSIAPLEDCYEPQRSPQHPRDEHRQLARALAEDGVDLLLVETFPHVEELLVAVEESVATGLETWASLTAGPNGDLLTPNEIAAGAQECVARGAEAVLVNCIPTAHVARFLEPLQRLGVRFGAYANAGRADSGTGFITERIDATEYARTAQAWADMGASILGGCCGTGVAHVRALRDRFRGSSDS